MFQKLKRKEKHVSDIGRSTGDRRQTAGVEQVSSFSPVDRWLVRYFPGGKWALVDAWDFFVWIVKKNMMNIYLTGRKIHFKDRYILT